jgi:hypothetical protein
MSEQEKNSIREQHSGGMKVMTENFNKLINSKLGDSKPLVNEQPQMGGTSLDKNLLSTIIGQANGGGFPAIQSVIKYCKSKNVPQSTDTKYVSNEIGMAIKGGENPINVMGGAPGLKKAAEYMIRDIKDAQELCSLIKYYSVNGEDFETAIKGEINTKMNSTGAADFILQAMKTIVSR